MTSISQQPSASKMSSWADLSEGERSTAEGQHQQYDEQNYSRSTSQQNVRPAASSSKIGASTPQSRMQASRPQQQQPATHTHSNTQSNSYHERQQPQQREYQSRDREQYAQREPRQQREPRSSISHPKRERNLTTISTDETGYIHSLVSTKMFGFITCCDREVDDLFFHFTDLEDFNQLDPTRDIYRNLELQFDVAQDPNTQKLQALNLRILPSGSIKFETIEQTEVEGVITKTLQGKSREEYLAELNQRSKRFARDDQQKDKAEAYGARVRPSIPNIDLSGIAAANGDAAPISTDIEQYEFAERDLHQPDVWLEVGDVVTFNVFVEKRSKRRGATDVKFVRPDSRNRRRGKVSAITEKGFGFIRVIEDNNSDSNYTANTNDELFFHFISLFDRKHQPQVGDELEFTIHFDAKQNKNAATRITVLPAGTIKADEISPQVYSGVVLKQIDWTSVDDSSSSQSQSQPSQHKPTTGVIQFTHPDTQQTQQLPYTVRDVKGDRTHILEGDTVDFRLFTRGQDQQQRATGITVNKEGYTKLHRRQGIISAVRDGFCFVDAIGFTDRLFLHNSQLPRENKQQQQQTKSNIVSDVRKDSASSSAPFVGMEVEFSIGKDGDRVSAIRAIVLPSGTVKFDQVFDLTLHGTISKQLPAQAASQQKPAASTNAFDRNSPNKPAARPTPASTARGEVTVVAADRTQQTADGPLKINATLPFTSSDLASNDGLLLNGDTVTFSVRVNKRDNTQTATQLKLESMDRSKREQGVVRTYKEQEKVGKVECLHSLAVLPFTLDDVLLADGKRPKFAPGYCCEFNVVDDTSSQSHDVRSKALKKVTRIAFLPKDSVVIDTIDYEHQLRGIVDSVPTVGKAAGQGLRPGFLTIHPQDLQHLTRSSTPSTTESKADPSAKANNKLRFTQRDLKSGKQTQLAKGDNVTFFVSTRTAIPNERRAAQIELVPTQATVQQAQQSSAKQATEQKSEEKSKDSTVAGRLLTIARSGGERETLTYINKDVVDSQPLREGDTVEFADAVFDPRSRLRQAKKIKLVSRGEGTVQPTGFAARGSKPTNASSGLTSQYARGPPQQDSKGFGSRPSQTSAGAAAGANPFDILDAET